MAPTLDDNSGRIGNNNSPTDNTEERYFQRQQAKAASGAGDSAKKGTTTTTGGGGYSVKPKWLVSSQSSSGRKSTAFRSSKFGSLHNLNLSDASFSSTTSDHEDDDDVGGRPSTRQSKQQQFHQQTTKEEGEGNLEAFVNARMNTWWYNMETIAMNIADAWNGQGEEEGQQQQAQEGQDNKQQGNPQESSDQFHARLTY